MITDYINKIYSYSRHEGLAGQEICNNLRELLQRDSISKEEYTTALENLSKVTTSYSERETAFIRDELKNRTKSKVSSSEPIVVTK